MASRIAIFLTVMAIASTFRGQASPQERTMGRDTFFSRVLRESPNFNQPGPAPYWGDSAYQKVDWSSVAAAVDVRVGEVLRVRTPTSEGSVKVARYAIHYNGPGDANLLLAVAQPL